MNLIFTTSMQLCNVVVYFLRRYWIMPSVCIYTGLNAYKYMMTNSHTCMKPLSLQIYCNKHYGVCGFIIDTCHIINLSGDRFQTGTDQLCPFSTGRRCHSARTAYEKMNRYAARTPRRFGGTSPALLFRMHINCVSMAHGWCTCGAYGV